MAAAGQQAPQLLGVEVDKVSRGPRARSAASAGCVTELVERADVVVRGSISASERTTEHGGPGWRSRLRVERMLKGDASPEVIIVEQLCEVAAGQIGSRWIAFLLADRSLLGEGLAPVNGPAGLLFLEGVRVKVPYSADQEFRRRYNGRLVENLEDEILRGVALDGNGDPREDDIPTPSGISGHPRYLHRFSAR